MSKGKAKTKASGKRVAARKPAVKSSPARAKRVVAKVQDPAPAALVPAAPVSTVPEFAGLTNAQKLNPAYLDGQNLRDLGYTFGLARSLMASMDDDKIRQELNLIAHRNAREDALAA